MSYPIPFGLKDGALVDIAQVDRGLACGCACPGCKGPLIARKGEVRMHHFALHGIPPCSEALASSIRAALAQLLAESTAFALPARHSPDAPFAPPTVPGISFVPDGVEIQPTLPTPLQADFALLKGGHRLALLLQFKRTLPVNHREAFIVAKQPALVGVFQGSCCQSASNFDQQGVRQKSWTGLCHKSEALSVFEGAT